jgi:valyl-tRNA synthetase
MSYDRHEVEKKWQDEWEKSKVFRYDFSSVKPTYSIDNPPPYASGSLHLGRATAYTLIDFVARYKRLRGYEVFFPLCFDVNGTPIEVRVEKKLNVTKKDVDRQEFIKMCSEFANENIKLMTKEFKMLGESMNPDLYYRTDSKGYRRLTQISFIRLFHKGLIYKGEAPVNWCPRCMTALADAEVEYRDRKTKLNHIKFGIEGEDEKKHVVIATTRPELLCAIQLVAVNPDDESKADLVGKRLITPVFGKVIDVIADDKVDSEFGTGVVMICTIGDKDDLEWVHKYDLPLEKGIDEEGRMTALCGKYEGMTTEDAKASIIQDMKDQGLLLKQEDLDQNVGVCWRCHTPIEFLQMKQWFLKTVQFKDDMLKMSEELDWYPQYMKIRLDDWINSLKWDWVISRQRYFATPIPIWECVECGDIIPAEEEMCYVDPTVDKPPVEKCPSCGGALKGCEDVFDTWMDSSISPLFNTFWQRDEKKFEKLFPMTLRPQAHDIIRTWTFYTMLRSKIITDMKPWHEIMIHGYIMAPDGKPMHSSLDNIIDPIPILKKYGADAFRYYTTTCSLGKDSSFMEKEIVHGFKLCTKFWNIQKFIMGIKEKPGETMDLEVPDKWILSRFGWTVEEATRHMDNFEFNFAMKAVEQFMWHEFADHYIEMVKYRMDDDAARHILYTIGFGLTKMLAPFFPHVTEEVYKSFYENFEGEKSVHLTPWPSLIPRDEGAEVKGEALKDVVSAIRSWKASKGIKLNADIALVVVVGDTGKLMGSEAVITGTTKVKELRMTEEEEITEEVRAIRPNYRRIGTEFRENASEIIEVISNLPKADLDRIGKEIGKDEVKIELKSGESVVLDEDMVNLEMGYAHSDKDFDILRVKDYTILVKR